MIVKNTQYTKNNMDKKILIGTGIGILALVVIGIVLISGCVDKNSQLTREDAIKMANDSEYVKSLFELYDGATIDGKKVEVKITDVIKYKHYDIIYFLDDGTNVTEGSFSYERPKSREGFYPCSAGMGCPKWYSHIINTEIIEFEPTAYVIAYSVNNDLMRVICVDNSTLNYRNETVSIYQQECYADLGKGAEDESICSKYYHYCNTNDECVGYTWQNDCMGGIHDEECGNTFQGGMPRSNGCMKYEGSDNCHCINNTCTTLNK